MVIKEKQIRIGEEQVLTRLSLGTIPGGLPFTIERFSETMPLCIYDKIDHYVLCWSSKGSGKMRLGLTNRDLLKGQLYLLRPGLVQTFLTYPLDGWIIRFRPQFVSEATRLLFFRPSIALKEAQLNQLNQLAEYLNQTDLSKPDLITCYVRLLVELAGSIYRERHGIPAVHAHEQTLLKLLDLIDQHCCVEHRTKFYAERLGIVDRKLNEISLKGTGLLVPELIDDRRLCEAETLLSTTKLLLKEISYQLGFINSSQFNYWFRQRRRVHPRNYRQATLKDASYR